MRSHAGTMAGWLASWATSDATIVWRLAAEVGIRSLQTGSSSTVALYRDAGFGGACAEFAPNTKASTMNAVLAGRVRSLTVSCAPKSQVSNHRVLQRFDDYGGDTGGSNGIHTSE